MTTKAAVPHADHHLSDHEMEYADATLETGSCMFEDNLENADPNVEKNDSIWEVKVATARPKNDISVCMSDDAPDTAFDEEVAALHWPSFGTERHVFRVMKGTPPMPGQLSLTQQV